MGLNYMMNDITDTRNLDNDLLPNWAKDERLFNCEGNLKGLFRELFLGRLLGIFR